MNAAQMQARAIQRAHDEHVYIRRTARPNVYTTVSKSNPHEHYSLVADGDIIGCSCRGFEYRASCKHVEALRNRLAREATRRQPAQLRPETAASISRLYPEAA